MYSRSRLIAKYLRYYFTASNGRGHGTHSPFIFEFITKVLNDKKTYPEYETVENLRNRLLTDRTMLNIEDLGAGSSVSAGKQRTVASIAKHAAKSKKYGQLLFRMVKHYRPRNIVELGTSLGLTTSYLSLGDRSSKLVTLEGAAEVAAFAKKNFEELGLTNCSVIKGDFDDTLPICMESLPSLDLVFLDGNHRREPTERYFSQLLPKIHSDSILVFDDIYWSQGMEEAWKFIKEHPAVRCSVDLFFIGIVLFRKEFHEKQHFSVRF
ncbi:MAG TPA: class I SAM-dependent methyltransferase [Chitinophagaceae bacterium]|nr:class I SAM-dependent methyltransferase [Chitinophagaceae bacterium]